MGGEFKCKPRPADFTLWCSASADRQRGTRAPRCWKVHNTDTHPLEPSADWQKAPEVLSRDCPWGRVCSSRMCEVWWLQLASQHWPSARPWVSDLTSLCIRFSLATPCRGKPSSSILRHPPEQETRVLLTTCVLLLKQLLYTEDINASFSKPVDRYVLSPDSRLLILADEK